MSFLFNWLWGASPDPRESARNSIVALREQLLVLDKREEHLQRKIDEELAKAKANVSTNKARKHEKSPLSQCTYIRLSAMISSTVASSALRQKKAYETELERIFNTRLTLSAQASRRLVVLEPLELTSNDFLSRTGGQPGDRQLECGDHEDDEASV
jgi:charged multivesicular body protein 4